MIFNKIFKRTKNNAQIQPRNIMDFTSGNLSYISNDSTAFACMDKIASEFALLNYGIYESKTRQKVKNHKLYSVLKMPNLEDPHFNFFYQSAMDYFNGGVYWRKIIINGQLESLFRLNTAQVHIQRNQLTNEKEYYYNGEVFNRDDVIFIPSRFSYSTLRGGQSIFDSVASAFKTSSELEKYTQASFSNGGLGKRLVIDVQGAFPNITEEQSAELRNGFQASYGGAQNAGKPLLKKKGFEYSEIGSNTDNRAQELSENRKFQEHEISKIFGVPETLINMSEKASLENTFTLFNEFAIRPLATQFQEAINQLLGDNYYFEFDYNGVMKVSLQQRIDAYIKQIQNGLLSPNEARQKENMSPIEAGDNHFMAVNLMPLNDETIKAYMAKQKNEVKNGNDKNEPINPTDEDEQHFGGGDDKQ